MGEPAVTRAEVDAILAAVADRGPNLRGHLPGPIRRGIGLRIEATGAASVSAYRRRVEEDDAEVARLVEAMVVPVSGLFRDPEVFEALERVVVPTIAAELHGNDLLRVWAAGSATGEEAWSLAVVLSRACPSGPEFRVVGSDIAGALVSIGRAGRYPATALDARWACAAAGLLWRERDEVVASDLLRARVAFGEHDLLGDAVAPREAVVASFHVIALRNVLIYMGLRSRRRAMTRVLSALERGGALVLGAVETVPRELATAVEPFPGVDPLLRIYRKRGAR